VFQKFSVPAPGRKLPALDDVSVSIAQNEFFTLLGPSGCDKITLLRLISGFRHSKPDSIFLE
jgi:spermidine/putrescine transport system ATP-binding protein